MGKHEVRKIVNIVERMQNDSPSPNLGLNLADLDLHAITINHHYALRIGIELELSLRQFSRQVGTNRLVIPQNALQRDRNTQSQISFERHK